MSCLLPAFFSALRRSSVCSAPAAHRSERRWRQPSMGGRLAFPRTVSMAERVSHLQRVRIHRALSRPNLLFGADRELVLITGLASVILIFVVLTWFSALFGMVTWIF